MHMNRSHRVYKRLCVCLCVCVSVKGGTKKLATCPTNWMTLIVHLKGATLPPTEAPLQIAGLQLRLAHLPLKYSHAICRSRYPK